MSEFVFNPYGEGSEAAKRDWQDGDGFNQFPKGSQEWLDYNEQKYRLEEAEINRDYEVINP